jgi:hypothetical protein
MDEKRKLRLNQICSTLAKNSLKVINPNNNSEHEEAHYLNEHETQLSHLCNKQQVAGIDLHEKLDVITSILTNDQIVLNSIQLINLIDIYYDETNHTNESQVNKSELSANGSLGQLHLLSSFFPCIACSMSFEFDQTFHLHMNRRCVYIRLFCTKCNAFKTYFNKCKLLYHIYSHKSNLFERVYKSVKFEALPYEKLSVNKERPIDFNLIIANIIKQSNDRFKLNFLGSANNYSAQDQSLLNSAQILNSVNNGYKLNEHDMAQMKQFIKRFLINKFFLFKCNICDAYFFDLNELKDHFAKSKYGETRFQPNVSRISFKYLKQLYTESSSNLTISNCSPSATELIKQLNEISSEKFKFTTRCSQLASLNLIKQKFNFFDFNQTYQNATKSIYVCPECGLTYSNSYLFRLHLIYDCQFTTKYECGQFICPFLKCNSTFYNLKDAIAHCSVTHVFKEYQCDLCHMNGIQHLFTQNSSNPQAFEKFNRHVKQHFHDELHSNQYNCSGSTGQEATEFRSSILKQILSSSLHEDRVVSSIKPTTFPVVFNSSEESTVQSNSFLNSDVLDQVNKHYFEKHRNEEVALKLVYKCLCKTDQCIKTGSAESNSNECCVFSNWKTCCQHISSLLVQSMNNIKCFICKKMISNGSYQEHMNIYHKKEKFFICPLCGVIKCNIIENKAEMTLYEHIITNHYELNLNIQPISSFFNVITTTNNLNLLNGAFNASSVRSLIYMLSDHFTIYQCINCRLYFSSETNFLHNCWDSHETQHQQLSMKQPNNQSNYFSPIYLRFNLKKVLNSKLAIINSNRANTEQQNGGNVAKRFKINEYSSMDLTEKF